MYPYGFLMNMQVENSKIGLALGGGGIKGLAHIALLKKLDELSIKPYKIAGTSIGAIIGALYACGLSGSQIEERIKNHIITKGENSKAIIKKRKALVKWLKVFSLSKEKRGLLQANGLFNHLFTEILETNFEELDIPFCAIATDYYSAKEVCIETGSLLEGVQASMAVPGVFPPVKKDGKTLIDGGVLNNLPCNHLSTHCDFIIASDVISLPTFEATEARHMLSGALSILLSKATETITSACPPQILFKPNTEDIDAFDFHKIEEVLIRGERAISEVESNLLKISNIKTNQELN